MDKVPSKLAKEPLVDVLFEVRFTSTLPASNILPGMLASALGGQQANVAMSRLPAADIPEQIRASEPQLQYAPVVKVSFGRFAALFSDRSVSVQCVMPYAGWAEYKAAILLVLRSLSEAWFVTSIERHSMKYVDVLEISDIAEQIAAVNIDVSVGGQKLSSQNFQLRMDFVHGSYTNIVQIVSNAAVAVANGSRFGIVVDIDIIRGVNLAVGEYLADIEPLLEEIHQANKTAFFGCLTPKTIESLEPHYE